jgi:hypothetical protein
LREFWSLNAVPEGLVAWVTVPFELKVKVKLVPGKVMGPAEGTGIAEPTAEKELAQLAPTVAGSSLYTW